MGLFSVIAAQRHREPAGPPPDPDPPPAVAVELTPAIVATSDMAKTASAAESLGADLVRLSYDIATPASGIEAGVAAFAAKDARVLLCATFNGRTPTQPEAEGLAGWADRFGWNGTFWADRTDGHLAVRQIEFGHETSYGYQYGDGFADASYATRAQTYATRIKQAHDAIAALPNNRGVGLLCQAEDGGSSSPNWVNNMFAAVANLDNHVDSWVIHPYGPGWEAKTDRLISHTAAAGAPATVPIDITSIGIASDNGPSLADNFGWPVNQTYADAGSALSSTLGSMNVKATLQNRLRIVAIREAHDLTASGANTVRDNYLGALTFTLGEKGPYSTTVRSLFGGTPPPPPPPPPPENLPIVVPSVGSTPATLRTGSTTGPRLQLKGMNVWGLRDQVTTTFGAAQYQARATVAAAIKARGANVVRFRVLADDYNGAPSAATGQLTKPQIIQQIKDWRDTVVGQGMYFVPCTWDALDGAFSDANWAGNGHRVHQMFTDIYAALGNDPMVFYEVTNEPNNVTWDQWQTNMQASILHFRETMGYKGVLVIDPINWANSGPSGAGYDDTRYTTLETYDAARAGMGGNHQLVFAKHDYSNNYGSPNGAFNSTNWIAGAGGSQIKHLVWANEFGNYNGAANTVNDQWSQDIALFLRDRYSASANLNYVGAAPFLWGPWFDANAITGADNQAPTTPWGNTIFNYYLGSQNPPSPPPPPPTGGFQPGLASNSIGGLTNAANGADSLNAEVARIGEFDINTSAASMDTVFDAFADRGIRLIVIASFHGRIPTVAEAQNMANWANRFGPGGAFWSGRPDGHLAMRQIEFGNETSFGYQYGDTVGSASYNARAQTYAQRFQTAYQAILATGKAVGLLCQGDDAGSGNQAWINNMFTAVPSLASMVNGWVVHPYGPTYLDKTMRMVNALAARGAPATIPIDITEVGIATDNGATLNDNYGWATNMTYAQAATQLQTIVNNLRNHATIGPRLRHLLIYQTHDLQPSGTGQREHYFGGLKNTLAEKGALSTTFRNILAS